MTTLNIDLLDALRKAGVDEETARWAASLDARLKAIEETWRTLNEGCREMNEEDRRRLREP